MMGGQTYTFKNDENYLNWTSGNTLSLATAVNDNTSWNVTFNGNIAKISPVTQEVEREIAWNNQNNGQKFAAYKCTSLYNNDGNMSANYGAITLFKNGTAVTSIAENDVVVLASETVKKELNTVGTSGGTGADYTDVPNGVLPLTVGINGEPAVYNTNPSCEGPVVTQNPVITPGSGTITTPTVTVEITCPTEGAVIYYTLDGTTPTAESTVYSAPIVISETTTVSAIAIVAGGEPSEVVSCTYTFPTYVDYANIKAFKDAYDATSSEIARITGDVTFVFRNGNYMYVQDATAGLLIFDNNNIITNTYNNGDVISGGIIGTMSVYYGRKELKPTANPAEGVAGTAVTPTPVTVAEVLADYNSYDAKFVKLVSVNFTEDHAFTNSGAGRSATIAQDGNTYTVYNQFKTVDLTVEAEQEANVIGFIGVYNDTKQIYPRDNEDIELVAPVEPETVTINATTNPAEGGTVTGTGIYSYGETAILTAIASEGYEFVNWTEAGEVVSEDTTYGFTVTGDVSLVANFMETITPYWIPEDGLFEDNMTFTAVIQIDGVEQYSPMLEVGAFCGEQCRGSQLASLFEPTQRYLVQLTIFGETNDLISFRLYDHATEQELDLSSPAPVSFTSNGYGTLSNPFVLNFISAITHEQAMNNGWNWWSTYVELEGTNALEQLENSLGANGLIIKSRNNGYVEPYNDNGTIVWYGNLSALHNEQTYKVKTNGSSVASLTGLPVNPADHPITLNTGWNWIGFPSTQNVSIATALSGLDAAPDDIIKGRNGYASYYAENGYNGWYGTINTLEPGQGYMYRSNSNGTKTFTYAVGRGETTQANITPDHNFNKPQVDRFADNMTVTTVVELEGAELRSETYEIAAFVGDECRGSVKLMFVAPIDRYVAFLTVLGESGEAISFRLTDGVDTSLSEEEMTFVNDGIVGSLSDPATLRFGTLGVDESLSNTVSVYPNPSEGLFRVEGQGMRNIAVFNVYGQCVLSEAVNGDELTIDMRQYANGIYALRVVTDRGVISSTVVKQ